MQLRRTVWMVGLAALVGIACEDNDPGEVGRDGSSLSDASQLDGSLDGNAGTSDDLGASDSGRSDSGLQDGADASANDGSPLDSEPFDTGPDVGPDDSGPSDSGRPDTGLGDGSSPDTSDSDAATQDVGLDAATNDAASVDTGPTDGSTGDGAAQDTGPVDAGPTDTGPADAGAADTGSADAGPPDTGPVDTGAPLPVTCNEPGLTTETITDSASVGTPDSYFRAVTPGDPFCASITGGGSGTWSVVVSNGTSSGIYCQNTPNCAIRVPAGDTTLIVTAVTTDIGGYTLQIRRIVP